MLAWTFQEMQGVVWAARLEKEKSRAKDMRQHFVGAAQRRWHNLLQGRNTQDQVSIDMKRPRRAPGSSVRRAKTKQLSPIAAVRFAGGNLLYDVLQNAFAPR